MQKERNIKSDLLGKRFDKLLVVSERLERNNSGSVVWECLCDCGATVFVGSSELKSSRVKSCRPCIKDLTGKTFGLLTVVKFVEYKNKKAIWLCRCNCGDTLNVNRTDLLQGKRKYCKICRRDRKSFIGKKFGRLVVTDFHHTDDRYRSNWTCLCECGKNSIVSTDSLKAGCISCGCAQKGKTSLRWKGYEDIGKEFWNQIEFGALDRGLEFSITMKDVWDLFEKQDRRCAISNNVIEIILPFYKKLTTASLDRIDNTKGYNIDNIWWVHKHVNKMKLDFKLEYFLDLCSSVINKDKSEYIFKYDEDEKFKFRHKFTGYKLISGSKWSEIKNSAKFRKIPLELKIEEAWDIFIQQNGRCNITNIPLFMSARQKDKSSVTASLDRIDSNLGYTKNNIQWLHKDINQIKWEISMSEFIEWCNKIHLNRENIK